MKRLKFVVVATAAFGLSGCGAWWQNFQKDPIGQITTIIQGAQGIEQIAILVFSQLIMAVPADARPAVQAKFNKGIAALNHSMTALQAGLDAAAKAKQDKPDLTALMADVSKAAEAIQAIIDDLRKPGGITGATAAAPAIGYEEFVSQVSRLKTQALKH